jgi:hypothetical protein
LQAVVDMVDKEEVADMVDGRWFDREVLVKQRLLDEQGRNQLTWIRLDSCRCLGAGVDTMMAMVVAGTVVVVAAEVEDMAVMAMEEEAAEAAVVGEAATVIAGAQDMAPTMIVEAEVAVAVDMVTTDGAGAITKVMLFPSFERGPHTLETYMVCMTPFQDEIRTF